MSSDDWERGYAAGWAAASRTTALDRAMKVTYDDTPPPKKKRKASAYSKRYGAAFRKISPKYKNKSGGWKKDGFKRAQKAAHKMARK